MIKAIETQYKGYRFRSRLEARWAVFFDALGIEWEYESEGYDLGEVGWYLPDFLIRDSGTHTDGERWEYSLFIEVKPTTKVPRNEIDKVHTLNRLVGSSGAAILVQGLPTMPEFFPDLDAPDSERLSSFWTGNLLNHLDFTVYDYDEIEQAVRAARSARFEHGETP